ncbi:hypothetical protein LCGC14_1649190 [marine sediment metagenome]|uniref:Uncharacterized protein n=1 Tax=marine sediment metagenome TaxID=412755 RepID=A0A0F9KXI9_9ZZZZ
MERCRYCRKPMSEEELEQMQYTVCAACEAALLEECWTKDTPQ